MPLVGPLMNVGIDVFTCSYKEYGEHNLEGNATVDKYLTNRVVWILKKTVLVPAIQKTFDSANHTF